MTGGAGADTLDLSGWLHPDIAWLVDLDAEFYELAPNDYEEHGIYTLFNVENVIGSNLNDDITGDSGDNILNGGLGDDMLVGGEGSDILKGAKGNDILIGGTGRDVLEGGKGDDILEGGKGKDTLEGGKGADTFVFSADQGKNVVKDFKDGVDLIDLSAFGFADEEAALSHFEERGSSSNGVAGFKFNGTEIKIKGLDLDDISGADILI